MTLCFFTSCVTSSEWNVHETLTVGTGARKFVVFDLGMAAGIPQINKRGPEAAALARKLSDAGNSAMKAAINAFVSGVNTQSADGQGMESDGMGIGGFISNGQGDGVYVQVC